MGDEVPLLINDNEYTNQTTMTIQTAYIVEVMYSEIGESDGGLNYEAQEEALAYFEKMIDEVPNDYEFGQVDYMSFYKAEGDVEDYKQLDFSNHVKNIETMEWDEEEWNAALK